LPVTKGNLRPLQKPVFHVVTTPPARPRPNSGMYICAAAAAAAAAAVVVCVSPSLCACEHALATVVACGGGGVQWGPRRPPTPFSISKVVFSESYCALSVHIRPRALHRESFADSHPLGEASQSGSGRGRSPMARQGRLNLWISISF
jgi:hypothetical protein